MSKEKVVVPRRQVTAPSASTVDETVTKENELVQLEGESDEDFAARVEEAGLVPSADDANGDGQEDEAAAAEQAAKDVATEQAAIAEAAAAEAKAAAIKARTDLAAAEEAAANAEYQSQARAKAAVLEAEEKAKLDLVDVVVPKAFNLMLDSHEVIKYADGTYPMPRKHAEHWYAKAHGVRLYQGAKK